MNLIKLLCISFFCLAFFSANADEKSYQFYSYDSRGKDCKESFFSGWGASAAKNRTVEVGMMFQEFSSDAVIAESSLESMPFRKWVLDNLRQLKSWEDYERRRQFFFENVCGLKASIKRIVPPSPLNYQRLGKVYQASNNARLVRSFPPEKFFLSDSLVDKSGEIKELSFSTDDASQFESDIRVFLDTKNVVFRMIRTSKKFDSGADLTAFKSVLLRALFKKYPNIHETNPPEPSFFKSNLINPLSPSPSVDNAYPGLIDYSKLPKATDIYLATADKRYRISIVDKGRDQIQLIYSYPILDKELSYSVEFEDLADVRAELGREAQKRSEMESAKQKRLDRITDKVMSDI